MKRFLLKDITSIYSGATPSTRNNTYYENGNISWITPKDLSGYSHKYIYSGQRNITKEGFDSCAAVMLPKGAVLLSSRAPIGYVAIAGKELCTNQGFKSFICDERYLINEYLYYYLLRYRRKIEALGNGSTFKEISKKTIADYIIELPSVDEQREAIAELSDLDKKYDSNCTVLNQLEKLMECIYCRIFESGGIEYKTNELKRTAEIITGGTPSTKNESYWNNGIYSWYTPSDVTSNKSIISFKSEKKISVSGLTNSSAKLIPADSVLMTSRATVGEAVINMFEATTNQGMLALVPTSDTISALMLYYWIKRNKEKIKSIGNGSTFKEVLKKDMERLKIVTDHNADNEFSKQTNKLFELYKSLVRENTIILELSRRLLKKKL